MYMVLDISYSKDLIVVFMIRQFFIKKVKNSQIQFKVLKEDMINILWLLNL